MHSSTHARVCYLACRPFLVVLGTAAAAASDRLELFKKAKKIGPNKLIKEVKGVGKQRYCCVRSSKLLANLR